MYPSADLIPTWIGKIQHPSKAVCCGVCCEPLPLLLQSCLMLGSGKRPRALLQKPVCSNRFFLASLRLHRQNSEEFLAYYMCAVRSCPHFSSASKTEQYSSGGMLLLGSFSRPRTSEPTPEFHCHTHMFKTRGLVCAQLSPFCVHQYSFFIQCKVLTMEMQTY